ncbi:FAD-dependent oxidoreductase [Rhodococcus fascians]|nr:FAD-dependent oxidoreductase [Rhodococcus fascians]MBY4239440.1 FAD-dependent oxidoreductase [Rhodococcus fascians]MBY4254977.1 FAD-dependent oxidoreductase [Rhodococcus fascians]MBY4270796.1 FAD-dependent oxidoreductase [Rhodococcus fascians]
MFPNNRSEHTVSARVVIIGSGQAGVQAADALRAQGHTGSLTVVGDEPVWPYQRPPLSKGHLAPGNPVEPLPLRAERFFTEQSIVLRTGVTATSLDRTRRTVYLDDGSVLPYDSLILATGAANRVLGVPGSELAGVHTLRTLADADLLRRQLHEARDVLVVGAGFVGLEVAAAARAQGSNVTVLEATDRPLSRAVSRLTADHVAAVHRQAGTNLRMGEVVSSFTGSEGRVVGAVTDAGMRYRADLVVVGIGAIPRTELAAAADLPVSNGIVVDEFLRTHDPAVFAIGDCANYPSLHTGTRVRLESVQNATDQGRRVAAVILGLDCCDAEVPWFWSHQGALKLQIAGLRLPDDTAVLSGDPTTGRFSVCCFRNGRLAAVESVNRPGDHIAARALLASRRSPDPGLLDDPTFSLKKFAAQPDTASSGTIQA